MKTNKVIASALAFIMATTVAAGSVYAAGEKVTISASKAEAKAGSEFSIDISLADVPATGIMACEFALSYDASVLSITDVAAGAVANTGADGAESDISSEVPSFYADYSTAGTINLTWSTGLTDSNYWINDSGVFATIKGTVKDGAAAGEYPISVVAISRDDISGTNNSILIGYVDSNSNIVEYEAAVADGAVVVVEETVTTPSETTTTTTETTTTTTTTETTPTETTTTTTETTPTETTTTTTTVTDQPTESSTTTTTATEAPGSSSTATSTTVSSGTTDGGDVGETLIGDVNLDKLVSLVDVICLNKSMAGAMELNDQQKLNANTCDDGTPALNGADVTALLKHIVRLIDALPVIA